MKIVIIGGGPCGLGAAWRIDELGFNDWTLFEKCGHWGGLAASYQDAEGFWWDFGGHVLFSHYRYFDNLMDSLFETPDGWLNHQRKAWIWIQKRFIPYPIQNNIHLLPKKIYWECLEGIIDIQNTNHHTTPEHFGEWLLSSFGEGLAKWFLRPYNFKVWGFSPEELDWRWVGERVAPVDLKHTLKKFIFKENNTIWGPNAQFRFPLQGGTGQIFRAMAEKLPKEKLFLNRELSDIDARHRSLTFTDGTVVDYDILVTTLPLDQLVRLSGIETSAKEAECFKYSGTHVVGIALNGAPPDHLANKCWIYFPEDNCPFYRATVFSNYSPNNVPDIRAQWSLMLEVCQSPAKSVNSDNLIEDVIQGALNTGLLANRGAIHHTWHRFAQKGYPTPSRNRNQALFPLLKQFESMGIYSRGRFGAWRYEVGNMDHCVMQGVECINHLLESGEELTLWYPHVVNNSHPSGVKR